MLFGWHQVLETGAQQQKHGLGTLVKLSKNNGFLENIAFGAGKTIRK